MFVIASGVGTPICTDSLTGKHRLERAFGHYARVLVDMNLAQDLVHIILVERAMRFMRTLSMKIILIFVHIGNVLVIM